MSVDTLVVTGAGGFIGGHLVAALRQSPAGHIRAVDRKPFEQWYQRFDDVENVCADLSELAACRRACDAADEVYNFSADMGGISFIEGNKARCMLSVLINTHLLVAARDAGVGRYFFASSACVYSQLKQQDEHATGLREEDAYPAMPEDGYGWEKLFSERMCRHFSEDFGLTTRVARLHNVYGPHGSWRGGREKAPAAICRKVAEAKASGSDEIEVWGSGRQSRSFTYIDDCIEGVLRIMRSDIDQPVNLGSSELVTIDELVDIVAAIAGTPLRKRYVADAAVGVPGRNSDNRLIRSQLGWEPRIPLRTGLVPTYAWIAEQLARNGTQGT